MVNILDTVEVKHFGLEGIVVSQTKASASILIGTGNILPFKKDQLDVLSSAPEDLSSEKTYKDAQPGDLIEMNGAKHIYLSSDSVYSLAASGGWRTQTPRGDYEVLSVNIDPLGVLEAQREGFARVRNLADEDDFSNESIPEDEQLDLSEIEEL